MRHIGNVALFRRKVAGKGRGDIAILGTSAQNIVHDHQITHADALLSGLRKGAPPGIVIPHRGGKMDAGHEQAGVVPGKFPEGGQRMSTGNGKVVISGFHRALPRFDLRVGHVARHTLLLPVVGGGWHELPLDRVAPPGSALTFHIEGEPQA